MVTEMKYKLLCVDVDGTLACSDKSVSKNNINYLRKANDLGIKIAIVSGRTSASIDSIFKEIGIPKIAIALNGSYVENGDKNLLFQPINNEQVNIIYNIVKLYNLNATFSTPSISIKNCDVSEQWKNQIKKGNVCKDYIIAKSQKEYKELIDKNIGQIVKVSIWEEDSKKQETIIRLFEDTGILNVVKSDKNYVDITDKFCSKGNAIKALAGNLKISLEETVCISDNDNDKDMFECVGFSIAMENAENSIKKIADKVTLDNNSDGVAYAIKKYILEE